MKSASSHLSPLHTDLYQLTMAYAYWKKGMAEQNAVFHLFYRKNPFHGGFAVFAGLEQVVEWLQSWAFDEESLAYLSSLNGAGGNPLFSGDFLKALSRLELSCDISAVREGTVVFPHEPLIRVKGPIIQVQLLETALLNLVNFQTLVATKAARICMAAGKDPVLEFGLRRAQGPDGGLSASRAAFIGGVSGTSNVLAGQKYGIPVKGTHAHSWVMAFENELDAFQNYADTMPNNCIFLVDTYDTIAGIRHAIQIGKKLRKNGNRLIGIRLDSGDLVKLSQKSRYMLDDAGFQDVKIVASNDLDEYHIKELKADGAKIDMWGIGTKLVTAFDQPALGGVYKLAAIQDKGGEWQEKIKLSEQAIKISIPGRQGLRRGYVKGKMTGDMIYDLREKAESNVVVSLDGHARGWEAEEMEELLVPVFENGKCIYDMPDINTVRSRRERQLAMLPDIYQKLGYAPTYPVGLSRSLFQKREQLIQNARRINSRI